MHSKVPGAVLFLTLAIGLHSLLGQQIPEVNPDGIPYELIDAAPAIGVVRAVNPGFGFLVVGLSRDESPKLRPGMTLGVRRNGVIVTWGVIDTFEGARTLILALKDNALAPDGSSRARVGDFVILYPPKAPIEAK